METKTLPVSSDEILACHQLRVMKPAMFSEIGDWIQKVATDFSFDTYLNQAQKDYHASIQYSNNWHEIQLFWATRLAMYVVFERWKRKELEKGESNDYSEAYEAGTRSAELDAVLAPAKSRTAYYGGLTEELVHFPSRLSAMLDNRYGDAMDAPEVCLGKFFKSLGNPSQQKPQST